MNMRYYLIVPLGLLAALAGWWLSPDAPLSHSDGTSPAPLATPGTAAASVTTNVSPASLGQQLDALARCEQTQSCPVDNHDPYAAEYRRHQAMAALLDQLRAGTDLNDANPNAVNKNGADHLRQLAWQYLGWPDGHVQSAALRLLSALPPVPENVHTLTGALKSSFDAPLMRQALAELGRYPEQADAMAPFFIDMLSTGSLFAGQEVARGLLPFLTPANVGQYQALLARLEPQSAKARDLKAVLAEFEQRQANG